MLSQRLRLDCTTSGGSWQLVVPLRWELAETIRPHIHRAVEHARLEGEARPAIAGVGIVVFRPTAAAILLCEEAERRFEGEASEGSLDRRFLDLMDRTIDVAPGVMGRPFGQHLEVSHLVVLDSGEKALDVLAWGRQYDDDGEAMIVEARLAVPRGVLSGLPAGRRGVVQLGTTLSIGDLFVPALGVDGLRWSPSRG